MARTYTFDDGGGTPQRKHADDHSLSYSAASSVNSADSQSLLKGLDIHDSKELAHYLEQRTTKSVADSLAYSANAESLAYSTDARSLATAESSKLHGTSFLGGETKFAEEPPEQEGGVLFSPAEHSDSLKKRKQEKKKQKKKVARRVNKEEEEDYWYAKWWMLCFPDFMRPSKR